MSSKGDALVVEGKRIALFAERDPSKIPWAAAAGGGEGDIYVLECSGVFVHGAAAAAHLSAGARKVIISAPADTHTLLMGVNHRSYDPQVHHVVSNASCTTNCLAPVAKVVADAFGIEEALMTTVHAVTASQKPVDAPAGKKDARAGRSALCNIIPATTGAAIAVTKVLPELAGKMTGMAFRVPVADVSVVDLTVRTSRPASMDDVARALREAAAGPMRGILAVTDEHVVSSDFIGERHSAVVDLRASMALNDRFFKLIAWCGCCERAARFLRFASR